MSYSQSPQMTNANDLIWGISV